MAKLFNRAKMTTSTTGSGTVTLGSASVGYQTFADAGVSNGDVVQYVIEEGSDFEIGTGSYSSTGTSLTRSPTESSNSGNAISLTGDATVSITAVADDLNRLQNGGSTKVEATSSGASITGNLSVTGTVDGVDIAARNAVLTSTTTTADNAVPKAGGTMTGALRHDQDSLSASGGTLTINLNNSNNFYVTISANTTFAFSNKDAGRFGNIIVKQNATGGYSFTLPAECKTPVNGASIVQSTGANEMSILAYYVVDSSNILVNYIGDFA